MTSDDKTAEDKAPSPAPEPKDARTGAPGGDAAYRVLARKYRPSTFAALIGQEPMVRTLTNAFQLGRLAHAFMLTGVRGIGKTTTARIIARGLNCVGPNDEKDLGPTIDPCGVCHHCLAIAEDRHVDVLELDAASRTGVDEMREVIDGVRYRPTSARYKIYIIDEVHMLSKHAFNALLKTLEEPPRHVKFIFATTEIRKIPITVLSRCQRFDLRRVSIQDLTRHFADVAKKEGVRIDEAALHLIARAADGSVRDGLSLLDQAISLGGDIAAPAVRAMLGLADRTLTFDLIEAVFKGDIRHALDVAENQYQAGAEPQQIVEDLLELTHWLTRLKLAPEVGNAPGVPEAERVRGRQMAEGLAMAAVTRAWQMLLKGLGEVRVAPRPEQAAEMLLIRLAYAAELPTPADAVKATRDDTPGAGTETSSGGPDPSPPRARARAGAGDTVATAMPAPAPVSQLQRPDPATFQAVVALVVASGDAGLRADDLKAIHLVHFEPGRIEFRADARTPADLANRLSRFLNEATARRWVVTVATAAAAPRAAAVDKERAAQNPLVRAVLDVFAGARVEDVRRLQPAPAESSTSDEDKET
ncbi:MAG: DNA polymerase III subunit gamma/tau [Rhodospirillales bacterium]|nr:DNA polymerase III subunit gamma/tau [Rhodospirillales bacterium]